MKSDISNEYNIFYINLSLLDQFDKNNIIKLELKDQIYEKLLLYSKYKSDFYLNSFDQYNNDSIIKLKLRN